MIASDALFPAGTFAPDPRPAPVARLTPSGALTEALSQATEVSVDWFGIAVLAAWGAISAAAAMRWFRFT